MLGVPMLSLPGLAFANATSSVSVLKRPPSGPTMTRSKVASGATGMKSRAVSNGRALNSEALTAVPLEISSSVWPSGAALATISPGHHAAGAGFVVDDHGLAERLAELLADGARRQVGSAAGGIGHDEADGLRWKGSLRRCRQWQTERHAQDQAVQEDVTTEQHGRHLHKTG